VLCCTAVCVSFLNVDPAVNTWSCSALGWGCCTQEGGGGAQCGREQAAGGGIEGGLVNGRRGCAVLRGVAVSDLVMTGGLW